MTITRIDQGPRMSEAVIHGDTIYLAGHPAPARATGEAKLFTPEYKVEILIIAAKAS